MVTLLEAVATVGRMVMTRVVVGIVMSRIKGRRDGLTLIYQETRRRICWSKRLPL